MSVVDTVRGWFRSEQVEPELDRTEPVGPATVLTAYIEAWQSADAEGVFANTQRSYRVPRRIPPTSFRVTKIEQRSPVMADVHAVMEFPDGEARVFIFRLVCENEKGEPAPDGRWGINPASMRQYVPDEDEEPRP